MRIFDGDESQVPQCSSAPPAEDHTNIGLDIEQMSASTWEKTGNELTKASTRTERSRYPPRVVAEDATNRPVTRMSKETRDRMIVPVTFRVTSPIRSPSRMTISYRGTPRTPYV